MVLLLLAALQADTAADSPVDSNVHSCTNISIYKFSLASFDDVAKSLKHLAEIDLPIYNAMSDDMQLERIVIMNIQIQYIFRRWSSLRSNF